MLSGIVMAHPTFPCFIFFFYVTHSANWQHTICSFCLPSSTLECACAEAGPGSSVCHCVTSAWRGVWQTVGAQLMLDWISEWISFVLTSLYLSALHLPMNSFSACLKHTCSAQNRSKQWKTTWPIPPKQHAFRWEKRPGSRWLYVLWMLWQR